MEVGDVVYLKSEFFKSYDKIYMTIIGKTWCGDCICQWFDENNKLRKDKFPVKSLWTV